MFLFTLSARVPFADSTANSLTGKGTAARFDDGCGMSEKMRPKMRKCITLSYT